MGNRREFVKKGSVSSAGLAVTSDAFELSAKSNKSIIGANDRIHVAAICNQI